MNTIKSQKFHDAYITGNKQELDRLWREETPTTLIKFYPAKYEPNGENYFLEHLENKTIWLSSPMLFNDSFDCVYNYDYEYEATKMGSYFLNMIIGEREAAIISDSAFWKEKSKLITTSFASNMSKTHNKYERNKNIGCFFRTGKYAYR